MLTRNGKNNPNGSFDWKDAILDSSIMAGTTFFTSMGALMSTGHAGAYEIGVVLCATGAQFCVWLAIKRGLRKE